MEDKEPDLEWEKDLRISDDTEYHWKEVEDEENEERGKVHALRWGIHIKYKEELIKREFWWWFRIQKGSELFGIVWRIMLLVKIRINKQLDYVDFIINYLKNRRMGGFKREYMGINI